MYLSIYIYIYINTHISVFLSIYLCSYLYLSVPDYFALITRAMIVLEGIAVTGDPDFDLFRAAYPYR